MDCSKISKGMVIRNYRAMCELLCEPLCTGKSKIYQLKRWAQFFDYNKDGHKFCITRVRDTPLETAPVKRNRQGIYLDYVKPLLVDLLVCGRGEICVTLIELAYRLGMVNKSYLLKNRKYSDIFAYKKRKDSVDIQFEDSSLKMSEPDLIYFFGKTRMKINSMLNSALLSMEKHGIISVKYGYMIRKADDSSVIADMYSETRIYKARETAAKELGIKDSIIDPYNPCKRRIFYERVNTILREDQGWQSIYGIIKISFADGYDPPKPLSNTERNKLKKRLNRRVLDYFTVEVKSEKRDYCNDNRSDDRKWIEKSKNNVVSKPDFAAVQFEIANNLLKW